MKKTIGLVVLVLILAACSISPQSSNLEPEANYWQSLGTLSDKATGGDITVDDQGRIIAAVNNSSSIAIRSWNGSQWLSMATITEKHSGSVRLSSNAGFTFISHQQNIGTTTSIIIKTIIKLWDGTSWTEIGSFDFVHSMIVDDNGDLHIAYMDGTDLKASKWSGSWSNYGTTPLDKTLSSTPANASINLDILNRPQIAWEEDGNVFVRRWNGSSWPWYSTTPLDINIAQAAKRPSLGIDGNNTPVVSWYELETSSINSYNIYVKRWNPSSALWESLGSALDVSLANSAVAPVTSINGSGNPVVTWLERSGSGWNTYIKEWTGSAWAFVGANPIDTGSPLGVLNTVLLQGQLAVIWGQDDPRNPGNFYVKRYLSNVWQNLGNVLDVNGGQSARNAAISQSGSGPYVAWDENAGSSRNVYVKRRSGTWLDPFRWRT